MRYLKTATAAALAAAAIANAPAAQASPETDFLTTLNSYGFVIYDANQAIDNGWLICNALDKANGTVVAEAFYRVTTMDVPDRQTAALWVVAAGTTLCPWHNHTGV